MNTMFCFASWGATATSPASPNSRSGTIAAGPIGRVLRDMGATPRVSRKWGVGGLGRPEFETTYSCGLAGGRHDVGTDGFPTRGPSPVIPSLAPRALERGIARVAPPRPDVPFA